MTAPNTRKTAGSIAGATRRAGASSGSRTVEGISPVSSTISKMDAVALDNLDQCQPDDLEIKGGAGLDSLASMSIPASDRPHTAQKW